MPTRYVLLTLTFKEEDTEMVMGVLSAYPIVGVEMGIDEGTVCFDQKDWIDSYSTDIINELQSLAIECKVKNIGTEEDQNWNAEWEAAIDPVIVNERIAIVPEWKKDEVQAPLKIIISPKMSFGTGHHATTRMMCKLMERSVQPGEVWTDVGTGTGVLAILAVKLGAKDVYAFDNNEWSILNAEENIERNDCKGAIKLEQIELQETTLPHCDGIAANLYRHLVIPNAQRFIDAVKPGGLIIVSGILQYDFDEVVEPFTSRGCVVEEVERESEWCAIKVRRQ